MDDQTIRIVVVDDHRLFREGLVALLASTPDVEVTGEAGSGAEVLEVIKASQPDVVLMDISMPAMSGIEATSRIRADHPDIHVVMLTMLEDDDSLFAAMCAGAHGYLLKGADSEEVLRTVRRVAAGDAVFGPAMAERLTGFFQQAQGRGMTMVPFPELTDREREVLGLIADGHDNTTIARTLHVSVKTVSNHVSNIFSKLHVASRPAAVVAAREAGMGRRDRQEP